MKQRYRKWIAICLALVMALTLVACGDQSGNKGTSDSSDIEQESEQLSESESKDENPREDESDKSSKNESQKPSGDESQNPSKDKSKEPSKSEKPSGGASGECKAHKWTTQTIHHDAKGHYEKKVTGQEKVVTGYEQILVYRCPCGEGFYSYEEYDEHGWSTGHSGGVAGYIDGDPIYETRDIVEKVWVEDSPAWDETIKKCTICGATK